MDKVVKISLIGSVGLLAALLSIILLHPITKITEKFGDPTQAYSWISWGLWSFASVVLFVLAAFAMLHILSKMANPNVSFEVVEPSGRKVLIMPLSNFTNYNFEESEKADAAIVKLSGSGFDKSSQPRPDPGSSNPLADELKHSWVQNYRAIRPHMNTIKHIYLIPSTRTVGKSLRFAWSIKEMFEVDKLPVPKISLVDDFSPKVETVLNKGILSNAIDIKGVDYNNYTSMQQAFKRAVKHAMTQNCCLGDVCFEVAPGTKQASIAGAVMALNSEAILSYVDTNDGKSRFHRAKVDPGIFAEALSS